MDNLNGHGVSSVWKYLALTLASANITALGGYILFGIDSIKHSEIDYIMQTRAPYIHDKQRIEDHFLELSRRIVVLETRVDTLQNNGNGNNGKK